MRTTIRLEEALLRRVKRHAAERGTTFTNLVREALQAYLARPVAPPETVHLPAAGRGGLHPGVDLDDTARLLDIMDGRE